MPEINNDVDLETLLGKVETEEKETSGASDRKPEGDEAPKDPSPEQLEKDKESVRAQERIRELVEENNLLKSDKDKKPENKFEDLETFLSAVEDEPSRNLLKTYGDLMIKTIEKRYAPVENDHLSSKFDKDFDALASRLPSLSAHRDDLKKDYIRDPSKSVKALVGELVTDNLLAKVAPIERKGSAPQRGAPDLSAATKDDLYDVLESMKQ